MKEDNRERNDALRKQLQIMLDENDGPAELVRRAPVYAVAVAQHLGLDYEALVEIKHEASIRVFGKTATTLDKTSEEVIKLSKAFLEKTLIYKVSQEEAVESLAKQFGRELVDALNAIATLIQPVEL